VPGGKRKGCGRAEEGSGSEREGLRDGGGGREPSADWRSYLHSTMRTRLTWVIIVGVLAGLAVAAAVDELRSPGSPGSLESKKVVASEPSAARENDAPTPLPRCTAPQITVSLEAPGGSATIVVRHAWGKPCHLARLPIELTVRDRAGRQVRLLTPDELSDVAGDFSPGSERLITIKYLPTCNQRGPFVASTNAGPYFARRTLPADDIGCFTETRCEYASLRPTYLPWRKRGEKVFAPHPFHGSEGEAWLYWLRTDWARRWRANYHLALIRDSRFTTRVPGPPFREATLLYNSQAATGPGELVPGTRIQGAKEPGRLYSGEVGFSPSIVWFLVDAPSCKWLTLQLTAPGMSREKAEDEIVKIAKSLRPL
jgi:hypothetical protein